jgi:hypothetical protein
MLVTFSILESLAGHFEVLPLLNTANAALTVMDLAGLLSD